MAVKAFILANICQGLYRYDSELRRCQSSSETQCFNGNAKACHYVAAQRHLGGFFLGLTVWVIAVGMVGVLRRVSCFDS